MFNHTYLIDDDKNTLYLHRYFLNEYSFFDTLYEYQNAITAIERLKSDESGKQNLILVDLNMPIMSGWEFVDTITNVLSAQQLESTTIVVVSSSCHPRDISRAEAHPYVFSYIEKPFLPNDIERLLKKLSVKIQHACVA